MSALREFLRAVVRPDPAPVILSPKRAAQGLRVAQLRSAREIRARHSLKGIRP